MATSTACRSVGGVAKFDARPPAAAMVVDRGTLSVLHGREVGEVEWYSCASSPPTG